MVTSRALYSKNVEKDQSEKTHLSPLQPEYPPCNSTRKYRFASIGQYLLYVEINDFKYSNKNVGLGNG